MNRLRVHRGAEPFERIRMATEAWAEKHGGAPKIFMANMGPIPQHKARTDFSTAFLNVAALALSQMTAFPRSTRPSMRPWIPAPGPWSSAPPTTATRRSCPN